MSDKTSGKIEIKVGTISFSAEGEQSWLAEQLEKVLEAAKSAGAIQGAVEEKSVIQNAGTKAEFTTSLGAFIKAKGGDRNQVKRFLATAGWLARRGTDTLATASVTSALSQHRQASLTNPAHCLNQNVSKGHCEKKGSGFFITPEGWSALGENE